MHGVELHAAKVDLARISAARATCCDALLKAAERDIADLQPTAEAFAAGVLTVSQTFGLW